MRCHDAKQLLMVQRDQRLTQKQSNDDQENPDLLALQEHLKQCSVCCAFEQHQRDVDALLKTKMAQRSSAQSPREVGRVSTGAIMLAVQQQRQITQQLETIREQQRCRVARLRKGGTAFAAITFFTLGSIPLLLLAITLVQTDLMVHALSFLRSVVDVLYVIGQYIQTGLTIVTRNSLLLAAVAFAVVLMMGMWLRLMRPPQEA